VDGTARLAGVDVARGVAVLGMITAHVGYADPDPWSPTGWLAVADGRSAALFATLAGASLGLTSGGPSPVVGADRRLARARIAARAAALAAVGYVLVDLGTPVAVILPGYALMFVLALPLLGAPVRLLAPLAGSAAVLGPVIVAAGGGRTGAGTDPRSLLVSGYYPAVVWTAYVLAGLAAGRLPLARRAVQARLLLLGAALAVLGYGTAALRPWAPPVAGPYLVATPHANTTTEVVGNLGVALAVLAACLLLAAAGPARRALAPLTATGATALTVYAVHIAAIAVVGPQVVLAQRSNGTLLLFIAVTVGGCLLWRRYLGRGPLERAMRAASTLGAAAAARAPAPGTPASDPAPTPGTTASDPTPTGP
jgi:uncharacterized membrane protein